MRYPTSVVHCIVKKDLFYTFSGCSTGGSGGAFSGCSTGGSGGAFSPFVIVRVPTYFPR